MHASICEACSSDRTYQSAYCLPVGRAGFANGVRQCPAATCVDLSKYAFMKSDACLCNSPLLLTIAAQAGDARVHFLRVLVGALLIRAGL